MRTWFLAVLCTLFASQAFAWEKHQLQARLGAGASFGPQTFLMASTIEYRPDPYFSFGPGVQWGLSNTTDIFFPTFGGRFILPRSFWNRQWGERKLGFEASLRVAMGAVFREVNGFRFEDFGFETGINADFFITQDVFIGAGAIATITSANDESSFSSFLGTVGVLF